MTRPASGMRARRDGARPAASACRMRRRAGSPSFQTRSTEPRHSMARPRRLATSRQNPARRREGRSWARWAVRSPPKRSPSPRPSTRSARCGCWPRRVNRNDRRGNHGRVGGSGRRALRRGYGHGAVLRATEEVAAVAERGPVRIGVRTPALQGDADRRRLPCGAPRRGGPHRASTPVRRPRPAAVPGQPARTGPRSASPDLHAHPVAAP